MSKSALTKHEHLRNDADSLKLRISNHLHFTLGKDKYTATTRDLFQAVAHTVRDHLIGGWIRTQQQYYDSDAKRVYYLSMEFLMGKSLENSLVNLDLLENCKKAVQALGYELESLIDVEADAGLGNGGLGRLAACFLDSMATLSLPGYGYGIRYDYGIFSQRIEEGYQVETPDNWLRYGNPWEICRTEYLYPIPFYGRVIQHADSKGIIKNEWVDVQEVMAMAYDTPIPGYGNDTVNTLRLWQAKSPRGFDLSYFNHGDYIRAVEDIAMTENITKVLYPNDNIFEGKELRLKQEYLLVSATIQDIIRRYNKGHIHLDALPDKVAIQLNDTHPALAIAEMMRILVDREEISWEKAWHLTKSIFSYTNHTLLPEALERWPVSLLEKVLPRHLQIIYKINQQWLDEVPRGLNKRIELSIIEESHPKRVNMAHLAIVGSHKVNGVSTLHSELLKHHTFKNFWEIDPEKFTNKTNGVTPRRWLKLCNPTLSKLITGKIGEGWVTDLSQLKKIQAYENDANFRTEWMRVKRENKERLNQQIFREHHFHADPDSLFDCHVKRIHEYKRQLLNILRVIHDYLELKDQPNREWTPRTIIFSGKAAPGYFIAKRIIKLINSVATIINQDGALKGQLKVVFLENYSVTLAEKIIPAADLSEQISTAGTEASGTGNMKFALNGALTIGTLDGSNVEMCEEVGRDNIFIFGLKTEEVVHLKEKGYNPWELYNANASIRRVLDILKSGFFSSGDKELFSPLYHSLLEGGDPYCLLADFDAYIACQNRVSELFKDKEEWARKSIHNVANCGRFSSDRVIKEYAKEIWRLST